MNYYSFEKTYSNCPDTFTYYFWAASKEEVSKATDVPTYEISKCSRREVRELNRRKKHIDTVLNGQLVETF